MSSVIVSLFSTFIGWWLYKVIYASITAYFEIKKAKQEKYLKNTYVSYGPGTGIPLSTAFSDYYVNLKKEEEEARKAAFEICMECRSAYGSKLHRIYCGGHS